VLLPAGNVNSSNSADLKKHAIPIDKKCGKPLFFSYYCLVNHRIFKRTVTLKKALTYFFCFCFSSSFLLSQQNEIDSIHAVIKASQNDTTLARAYLNFVKLIFSSDPDTVIPTCYKVIYIADKNLPSADKAEKYSYMMSKGAAYSNIGVVFYQKGNLEKAVEFLERGIKIQEEIDCKIEIANTLNTIGAIYSNSGKPDLALNYYLKSLRIANEIGKDASDVTAFAMGNIGMVYDNLGQHKLALEYFFQSLRKQEENQDKEGIGNCLNNIATIFLKQGDYEKALEFYNKSIKVRKEVNDKSGIAQCLNNIGTLYLKKNKGEKAIEYYKKSREIYEELKQDPGIAYSIVNMAKVYNTLGDTKKALELYYEGLKLHEKVGDKKAITKCLYNISVCLLKESQPKEALEYAKRSLEISEEIKSPEGARDAYASLSEINTKLGNTAQGLDFYKKHIELRDSVLNQETRKASLKKQFQYEYEKKVQADRLLQEEEMKRQKLIYWSASGTLGLALLSTALLFNRRRLKEKNKFQEQLNEQQKQQANAVMETQESERKRIAEDLHDSIGHLLSTTKLNLQTIQGKGVPVENTLSLLNQASEEIRNITFNLMPKTLEEGGLIPALNELAVKVTNSGAVKVSLHVHDMEKFILEKQYQFNIYRIVQEAVNNILKHAEASEINIQVIGQSDHITIMVEDDGKGFDPKTIKGGRGLKNITTRSLWLKGHINIDSTPGRGTTITTEIPV
jgi:two-component system, NarL family, sensor kinase